MIDKTVSYKIVFPTFLLVSVLVATCAKISFIASEASASLCPSIRSRRRIFTYKEKRVTHLKTIQNENERKTTPYLQKWITNTADIVFR